jgi:signal transduction histidine kinase
MICVTILVGNTINLWDHLSLVHGETSSNGDQMPLILAVIANAVALGVLILFYYLLRYYLLKKAVLESELRRVEDNVAARIADRTEQLSSLLHHLMHSTEVEKAKLARELHSDFGACLTVISMDISVIGTYIDEANVALIDRIQHVLATVKDATDLKRRIVADLRPNLLDSLGLSFCLSESVTEFSSTNGLPVNSLICEEFDQIDSSSAIALFRVAQEAMSNVVKHAQASSVQIALQPKDSGLSLLIADNGRGMSMDTVFLPKSYGLATMRERMLALGGTLTVRHPENGCGTEIEAYLPLR